MSLGWFCSKCYCCSYSFATVVVVVACSSGDGDGKILLEHDFFCRKFHLGGYELIPETRCTLQLDKETSPRRSDAYLGFRGCLVGAEDVGKSRPYLRQYCQGVQKK